MARYGTAIPLQHRPIPSREGCGPDLLNRCPVLYTKLQTIRRPFNPPAHPSLLAFPIDGILPYRPRLNLAPRRKQNETPLHRLYVMYHYVVLGDFEVLRNEVEDFFDHHGWKVKDIPDPKDPNPERYAILAVIAQYLCHAFNRRVKIGGESRRSRPSEIELAARSYFLRVPYSEAKEQEPIWAKNVPQVMNNLVIPRRDGTIPERWGVSGRFAKKRIVAEEIVQHLI